MADRPQTFIKKQIFAGDIDFKAAVAFTNLPSGIFPVIDTQALVKDPADITKRGRIDVGNVATATTRTITMPNADVELFKDSLDEAVAPVAGDDNTAGYSVGSVWVDTTADLAYLCVDASTGAAVWSNISSGGGASLPVDDTTALVRDPVDNTKLTRIDTGAVATATTRTIIMPNTNVDLADIATNNAKVSNVTHTGEMTGSGALTAANILISNRDLVTAASGDTILIGDASDSGNLKKVDALDFLGGTALPVVDTTSIVEGSIDATKEFRFEVDGLTTSTIRVGTVPDKDFTLGLDDNAIHDDTPGEIILITEKATPTTGDFLIIEDGADSDNKKRVNVTNLPTAGGGEANTSSNSGAGVNVAQTKSGINLPFRSFTSADSSISWTENTNELDAIVNKDIVNQIAENPEVGTTYTLVLADADRKSVNIANAASNVITVPTNASVAYPIGTVIDISQTGAGQTTITGNTGVTVNGASAGSVVIQNKYGSCRLVKVATDIWFASGDLFAGGGGGGAFGQVVTTRKTDTFSMSSTTFTDVTGLTVNITPTSTSSTILVMVAVNIGINSTTEQSQITIADGAGVNLSNPTSPSNRSPIVAAAQLGNLSAPGTLNFSFVHAPASTSEETYKVQMRTTSAVTAYVNRTATDTDSAVFPRGISTITVMEILP